MEEMIAGQSLVFPRLLADGGQPPRRWSPEDAQSPNQLPKKMPELDAPLNQMEQPAIGTPPTTFTKVDYNVKMYYPKKFEVLRKFYCGSHLNFI